MPNRSVEYRKHTQDARARAATSKDQASRDALFQIAEIWELMARWEDRTNPSHPGSSSWRDAAD